MDKTSFKIFIFAITISLIIFVGLLFLSNYVNKDSEEVKLEYVTSPNIFFTVENCVNKYIQVLQAKDTTAVYNLIDKKYRNDNGITINNALANNKNLGDYNSFTAEKILEDRDNKNTYYVKGYLTSSMNIDTDYTGNRTSYSLIIMLDFKTHTYSVIPKDVEVIIDAQ